MKQLIVAVLLISCNITIYSQEKDFYNQLSTTALSLTKDHVRYDPQYRKIPYPN